MDIDQINEMDRVLLSFDDPSEAWDSKIMRKIKTNDMFEWIVGMADWKTFSTLTYREETPPDKALRNLYTLIDMLNQNLIGKRYFRKVGHSYFSYVVGIEYQKRDVIHFHMLTDAPIDFCLLHRVWNSIAGFAWTEIIKDQLATANYVAKYVLKGGDIIPHKAEKPLFLKQYPFWWNGQANQGEKPI
jgi:hypothetical protein